ncbi:MAG: thiamine-phosphate kinase [Planctomycetota bacterium]|nr:MAG: thiamine-phosphate kinase [Planctomycetota bacterium]
MTEGENELVAWLRERFAVDSELIPVGMGDDAAAVRFGSELIVITADMLLDGVHFDTGEHSFKLIGRKAVACSLSDCAAMGCKPRAATVSVALSKNMSFDEVKHLYEGMAGVADEFDCSIVGGDTTSWSGKLAIDVAMLAEPISPKGPILRSGARIGDTTYVSGPLGGSLEGRHLTFTPRVELGCRMALEPDLHAMMDISDGLALDLYRLCEASGCDAELYSEQLEKIISKAAHACAERDGKPSLEHALSDGEDFELLVVGGYALKHERYGLTPVGRIITRAPGDDTTIVIRDRDKGSRPIEPGGYEHFK